MRWLWTFVTTQLNRAVWSRGWLVSTGRSVASHPFFFFWLSIRRQIRQETPNFYSPLSSVCLMERPFGSRIWGERGYCGFILYQKYSKCYNLLYTVGRQHCNVFLSPFKLLSHHLIYPHSICAKLKIQTKEGKHCTQSNPVMLCVTCVQLQAIIVLLPETSHIWRPCREECENIKLPCRQWIHLPFFFKVFLGGFWNKSQEIGWFCSALCLFCKTVSVTHECCLLAVKISLSFNAGRLEYWPGTVPSVLRLLYISTDCSPKDTLWE